MLDKSSRAGTRGCRFCRSANGPRSTSLRTTATAQTVTSMLLTLACLILICSWHPGAGADIPPNAGLEFDVRLVAIGGKQHFYSEEHLATFTKKMEAWKEKELKKYDEKEAFRAKKDEKHGGREQFAEHLTTEVTSSVAEITVKPKSEW